MTTMASDSYLSGDLLSTREHLGFLALVVSPTTIRWDSVTELLWLASLPNVLLPVVYLRVRLWSGHCDLHPYLRQSGSHFYSLPKNF